MKENIGKLTTPSGEGASISIENNNISLDGKISGSGFNLVDITNVDLDTITSFGNYISHRYSKALNYPYYITDEEIEEDCILKVNTDTNNKTIIQELEIGKYSTFRRVYKDSSWNGWIQTNGININELKVIDTDEPGIVFYVSKTGNDNSDGFSWNTALLTIEEAIRRTKIVNPYYDNGNHEIRIGSGDWGSLNINHVNGLLTLTGYTDDIIQEFPRFSKLAFKDSTNALIQNLQVDILDVAYNSNVRINSKNKFHMVQSRFDSSVTILSDAYIQIINPIFESSKAYCFNIYTNSSLWIGDNITISIPSTIRFSTSFIRAFYNANVYWESISLCTWITPENLTVNGMIYARYNSTFGSNTDWNTSDVTQYLPFNYSAIKSIVDTSSFCGARNVDIIAFGGNSTAWYKKYNNGFIEQGGYVKGTSTSTNIVVTFSVAFTSTNYFIKKNRPVESATTLTYKGENFYNLTNTSATTWIGNEMLEFTWYACGY